MLRRFLPLGLLLAAFALASPAARADDILEEGPGYWVAAMYPNAGGTVVSNEVIAPSAALKTAGTNELVASEPPEIGPSGSELSPNSTSILSTAGRLLLMP